MDTCLARMAGAPRHGQALLCTCTNHSSPWSPVLAAPQGLIEHLPHALTSHIKILKRCIKDDSCSFSNLSIFILKLLGFEVIQPAQGAKASYNHVNYLEPSLY